MEKKLYRSTRDRKLTGVCGGLALYLGMDVTIIRLACAFLCLFTRAGLLAYIVAAIIIPEEPTIEA